MTKYIYLHQPQKAISYTQLPSFLFEAPSYKLLSNEAKLLYAFILRRADLSRKNGWADDYGRIYLYYPINEVVELLHCGRQKAVNTLRELQYADLIAIKKQGCGKLPEGMRRDEMRKEANGTTRDITFYQTQGGTCGGIGSTP